MVWHNSDSFLRALCEDETPQPGLSTKVDITSGGIQGVSSRFQGDGGEVSRWQQHAWDGSVPGLADGHTHSRGGKEGGCCSRGLPQMTRVGVAAAAEAESCSAAPLPWGIREEPVQNLGRIYRKLVKPFCSLFVSNLKKIDFLPP